MLDQQSVNSPQITIDMSSVTDGVTSFFKDLLNFETLAGLSLTSGCWIRYEMQI
jgi:hypothetical protein